MANISTEKIKDSDGNFIGDLLVIKSEKKEDIIVNKIINIDEGENLLKFDVETYDSEPDMILKDTITRDDMKFKITNVFSLDNDVDGNLIPLKYDQHLIRENIILKKLQGYFKLQSDLLQYKEIREALDDSIYKYFDHLADKVKTSGTIEKLLEWLSQDFTSSNDVFVIDSKHNFSIQRYNTWIEKERMVKIERTMNDFKASREDYKKMRRIFELGEYKKEVILSHVTDFEIAPVPYKSKHVEDNKRLFNQ